MEFVERHDIKKVHYLASLSYSQVKNHLGKTKNDEERKKKYENIKRFCQAVIKARGHLIRPYAYSLATSTETGGRLYCGLSVQGLPKAIRGFLMSHTTDIDMKNAHPTILYYLCRKHRVICPNLEHYVKHRDEILAQFPDKDTAKELFNSAVNNDKKNYKEKHDFFRKFDTETKSIQQNLTQQTEYLDIRESVPDVNKIRNWDGSAINRILCMYENRILQVALSVCNRKNIEIACPMFDGMMVYGQYGGELLDEITDAVEASFPGLDMIWDIKGHKDDIQMPDDYVISEVVVDNQKVAQNDKEASDIIYAELQSMIIYSKKQFYFKKDNLWLSCEDSIRAEIRHYVMCSNIRKMNDKHELVDYSQNIKNATNITTAVMDTVRHNSNDNWVSQIFQSSRGYVLFNNGYWDFKNGVFQSTSSASFDTSIIFMEKIPFDYDESFDDRDYMERLRTILFTMPFGDKVGPYYSTTLARGLAGDAMKRMLVGIGSADTGKSMLTSAIKSCCGGYFEGWNGANLLVRPSSQDEAQLNRWILLLQTKRLIFSNELKGTGTIDGTTIKKLSNGGLDPITARLHQGNEESFTVGFLPVLFAQDISRIQPLDDAIMTRLRAIPYDKVYVDEPSNEMELKKDPTLEAEIRTPRFQQAFLRLLFEDYLTFHRGGRVEEDLDEIKQAVLNVVGTETNIVDAFKNEYEITNDPEDFVTSNVIQQWLIDSKKGVSITKLGLELKRYAKIKGLEHLSSKDKKINKKSIKCWFGVRVIPSD